MYTLYCLPGSRATAAHMVLAEGGLPYKIRHIDITTNEHRTAEYLAINPRATVPALLDEERRVTVCETIAVMLYLADKHSLHTLAPGPTDPERGVLLDWLVYHAVEVQEPVKRSWFAHRHADTPEGETQVRARANKLFNQRWGLVEHHLRKHGPYHLGSRFSLVDIYLLVTSTFSDELAEGDFPAIAECTRLTGERRAIAPVLGQHMTGLERIAEVGVPR